MHEETHEFLEFTETIKTYGIIIINTLTWFLLLTQTWVPQSKKVPKCLMKWEMSMQA